MQYHIVTETYTPDGVYPIATMESGLHLPDTKVTTMKAAFRQYGDMTDHDPGYTSGTRSWTYRRKTAKYTHKTTITKL